MDFAALGFHEFALDERELAGDESDMGDALAYRSYHSVLLSPSRIDELLLAMGARLRTTDIVRDKVQKIIAPQKMARAAILSDGRRITGRSLVLAAGRLGADLLRAASVPEKRGKGIDVGVRLGFDSLEPLAPLRALGPDAKMMSSGVRTFCLNSPGQIFHYPGLGYEIPGGIVAPDGWLESNVGILCRLDDREAVLAHFARRAPLEAMPLVQQGSGTKLGWTDESIDMFTPEIVARIDQFVEQLANAGFFAPPSHYDVHLPLLDWHWPVFSLPGRLETGVEGVFAAGDVSGHARGLLQAVVMGRLAVEEALR
ncbi:hypothetical protein CMV14_06055 [Rhizorhabdus dicambivorans]|nr:hypothetical protein CMV14_06055 [Rhizorhabdus dicambivorans]